MKQNEDFFDYCEKRKKNVDGYNDIAKKIKSLNKKERQYYKIGCLVKLNKSVKDESISKNVLTGIAILITLVALSFSVSSTVNAIVDARMNKYIDNLESENQEARNIIDNIKNGKQEDRILQVFTYNQDSGEWEYGATKSEIDFYNDNISDNYKFINNNKILQIQQYSPMFLIISCMSIFMIFVIISLYRSTSKIEHYKNLVNLFDLY